MTQAEDELSFVGPLRNGEKVLWVGRPNPGSWRLNGKGNAIFFALIFFVISIILLPVAYIQIQTGNDGIRAFFYLILATYFMNLIFAIYQVFIRPIKLGRRTRRTRYAVTTHRALVAKDLGAERIFIDPLGFLPEFRIRRSLFGTRGTIHIRDPHQDTKFLADRQKIYEDNSFWFVEDPEGALEALESIRYARFEQGEDGVWRPKETNRYGVDWNDGGGGVTR